MRIYKALFLLLLSTGSSMTNLKRYKSKRDFKKTPEPAGVVKKTNMGPGGKFVIQQHAARAMHYDVRLEIGGTMVSWAVPKGPSLNSKNKRLAIQTEDHPIAYNKFEGIIPEGHYGAGAVIIWDRGTYKNIKENVSMKTCLQEGRIEVFLKGKKINGAFALVRTGSAIGEKSKWLLIKMRDEYADARRNITQSESASIKSGKTIKDMQQEMREKKRAKKKE